MIDQFERKIEYVRISLTDRCNMRCRYCMPETGVEKLRHEDILTFAEILRIVRAMAALGVRKVRLTGGEPLVRRGIVELVQAIHEVPGIERVVMTTNGVLLSELAAPLLAAGLDGVNISLDTLRPEVFAGITRRPMLDQVREGIQALQAQGLQDIKFNCVPIESVNEADIPALAGLAREQAVKVRFIELMPIGCAYEVGYHGVAMAAVRQQLEQAYGPLRQVSSPAGTLAGPAVYYRLPGFAGQVGFIDAMEHKFCTSCNRVRLTAEGFLKLCLNAKTGLDLRALLRSGITDENLQLAVRQAIYHKPAEHRFEDKNNDARDGRAMYQVGG